MLTSSQSQARRRFLVYHNFPSLRRLSRDCYGFVVVSIWCTAYGTAQKRELVFNCIRATLEVHLPLNPSRFPLAAAFEATGQRASFSAGVRLAQCIVFLESCRTRPRRAYYYGFKRLVRSEKAVVVWVTAAAERWSVCLSTLGVCTGRTGRDHWRRRRLEMAPLKLWPPLTVQCNGSTDTALARLRVC